ncbi:hypothetical protein N7456_001809 [Penicillium angulare]|uniref:DUF7600 domain-containing protein n=1 Tax=Penicillium angulare TaxID=116970 RepID=A0A9W9G717_9EURO|nr:hypothetical protein N7456_001809 [Penicillium angulare]
MSPQLYYCVICGYHICNGRTLSSKWLEEFRAIYSNPNGNFISGVGRFTDGNDELKAPTDPAERYDDEDFDPQLAKTIYTSFRWEGSRTVVSHDVCWKLLEEASKPNDINLERFLEICDSLPFEYEVECINWGHKYGNLYGFSSQDSYPWEYSLARIPDSEVPQHAAENPYTVRELLEVIAATSHEPLEPERSNSERESDDFFANLPWEIREAIATSLPIGDALNLCASSASFLPLLDSQSFWASQFQPGGDREFLFEKRKTAECRDWKALYRMTSYSQSSPGLRNRRRVWNLIKYIVQLCDLRLSDNPTSSAIPDGLHEHEPGTIMANAKINWSLNEIGDVGILRDDCRALRRQHCSIPHDLSGIALYFVGAEVQHLSGLCFKSKSGVDARLGYSSTERPVLYHTETLRGFALAIDNRGIRGLQVIDGNEHRSQWFGTTQDIPVTERLASLDTTEPLQITVDALKIVGMRSKYPRDILDESVTQNSSSLRSTALWYPSVPSSAFCLNEQSFKGPIPPPTAFSPMHWVNFGGRKGTHLQYLTDISLGEFKYPASVKFQYEQDTLIEPLHFGVPETLDRYEYSANDIDGPGGEYIQTVHVAIRDKLCALKLITNKGREFECGTLEPPRPRRKGLDDPIPEPEPKAQFETINVAPGTIITGLYAGLDLMGFPNFGVISEAIKRKSGTED